MGHIPTGVAQKSGLYLGLRNCAPPPTGSPTAPQKMLGRAGFSASELGERLPSGSPVSSASDVEVGASRISAVHPISERPVTSRIALRNVFFMLAPQAAPPLLRPTSCK